MSAPVRIEARAWTDIRFATLARLLGLADADHALIKVARLWSWQTEHFAPDQPTYEVDGDTIESVLGPGGPAAMVRAKLADQTATSYRIRGTEGQIVGWRRISPLAMPIITYAIEAIGAGLVKIGRTTDVPRRISELQTARPSELSLLAATPGDVERTIHAYLDGLGKRVRGEWFTLDAVTVEILAGHGIQRGR